MIGRVSEKAVRDKGATTTMAKARGVEKTHVAGGATVRALRGLVYSTYGGEKVGVMCPVVDIRALFETPADPDLQGPDGVHPSLVGQRAIAGAFVERLTS